MSKIPRQDVAQVLADRSLKHGTSKKLAREVAAWLLDNRRTGELDPLLRDIQADWAETGYVEALAYSAHDLAPKILADIKSRVSKIYPKAKKIIITTVYDPSVVGGVRIETADQQLDLTVQARLNKFKQLTSGEN